MLNEFGNAIYTEIRCHFRERDSRIRVSKPAHHWFRQWLAAVWVIGAKPLPKTILTQINEIPRNKQMQMDVKTPRNKIQWNLNRSGVNFMKGKACELVLAKWQPFNSGYNVFNEFGNFTHKSAAIFWFVACWRQTITWNRCWLYFINQTPCEIVAKIRLFSFKKIYLKMSSA